MRSQLEPLGRFRILEAWDAASLREVVRIEPRIDLALIDIMMPGMNGWQAICEFCEQHPKLPVLIVTATDTSPFVGRLQNLVNVRGLITKQHSARALRTVVDLALAGQSVWQSAALMLSPQLGQFAGQQANRRGAMTANSPPPQSGLSPRLQQVAQLVASGQSNAEVARHLGLTEGTVKNYLKDTFKFLGVSNRTQLALKLQQFSS